MGTASLRVVLWIVVALCSAITLLAPGAAVAHAGHEHETVKAVVSPASHGLPGAAASAGNEAIIQTAALRSDGLTDCDARADTSLRPQEQEDRGARLCTGGCCSGTGCCPAVLSAPPALTDRFPGGSDPASRLKNLAPDAVPEALPEPPRSFV